MLSKPKYRIVFKDLLSTVAGQQLGAMCEPTLTLINDLGVFFHSLCHSKLSSLDTLCKAKPFTEVAAYLRKFKHFAPIRITMLWISLHSAQAADS
jgi:hypothetical protein